jgi:hypothetical protein
MPFPMTLVTHMTVFCKTFSRHSGIGYFLEIASHPSLTLPAQNIFVSRDKSTKPTHEAVCFLLLEETDLKAQATFAYYDCELKRVNLLLC